MYLVLCELLRAKNIYHTIWSCDKKKSMSLFRNENLLIIFRRFWVNHDFTLSVLLGDIIYHILYLQFGLFW